MSISVSQNTTCTTAHAQPRTVWAKLFAMVAVARQRRQLLQLDDHLLRDIGLQRKDAVEESKSALWNVPNHWRG